MASGKSEEILQSQSSSSSLFSNSSSSSTCHFELLPEELSAFILSFLPPYFVARVASQVNQHFWRCLSNPAVWSRTFEFEWGSSMFQCFRERYPAAVIENIRFGDLLEGESEGGMGMGMVDLEVKEEEKRKLNRLRLKRIVAPKHITLYSLPSSPETLKWMAALPLESLSMFPWETTSDAWPPALSLASMKSLRTVVLPWDHVSQLRGLPVTDLTITQTLNKGKRKEYLQAVNSLPLTALKLECSLKSKSVSGSGGSSSVISRSFSELKHLRLLELQIADSLSCGLQMKTEMLHTFHFEAGSSSLIDFDPKAFPSLTHLSCVLNHPPPKLEKGRRGSSRVLDGMKLKTLTLWISTDKHLRNLGRLPELATLNLWSSRLQSAAVFLSDSVWPWLSIYPKLSTLRIGLPVGGWKSISSLKHLRNLSCNDTTPSLESLVQVKNLQHLFLDASIHKCKDFQPLAMLPSLRTLRLTSLGFPAQLLTAFLPPSVDVLVE